jgi:short-subunit dehydrogenase
LDVSDLAGVKAAAAKLAGLPVDVFIRNAGVGEARKSGAAWRS